MSEKIIVTAKVDGGNHAIYGQIKKGEKYNINPDHFADELFERPKGFKSRLEIHDEERRGAMQAPAADSKKSTAPAKSAE